METSVIETVIETVAETTEILSEAATEITTVVTDTVAETTEIITETATSYNMEQLESVVVAMSDKLDNILNWLESFGSAYVSFERIVCGVLLVLLVWFVLKLAYKFLGMFF